MLASKKQNTPAFVSGLIEFLTYSISVAIFGVVALSVASVPAKMRENRAISERNAISQEKSKVPPCFDCLATVAAAEKQGFSKTADKLSESDKPAK